MKRLTTVVLLLAAVFGASAVFAQKANDTATQNAILQALPSGVTADMATADQVAQAAIEVAFNMGRQGAANLPQKQQEANLTQVMLSLEELTRAGKFPNAPRFGEKNPPGRFYTRVLNIASSNLDVASDTYYGTTVQYIIGLTAAMREGQNRANGATAHAITAK
jgi:uncharacterized iron-regulated membrane protein